MSNTITTILFDLGGVLIDWNPRYVYHAVFNTKEETDWFLQNICTHDWNEQQDAGQSLQDGTEELVAKHPRWEKEIRTYYQRWSEMLGGPLPDTVELFRKLREQQRYKFYALTNWSAETFPVALDRYEFLHWFEGILVSGAEGVRKPFPRFYELALQRFGLHPSETIFIDDNGRNVEAARALGIKSIHFQSAEQLTAALRAENINF
jgi:2-haloacid dehalogenase